MHRKTGSSCDGFFFRFCEVAIVTIIQKRKEPKLAIGKTGQQRFFRILLCYGTSKNL